MKPITISPPQSGPPRAKCVALAILVLLALGVADFFTPPPMSYSAIYLLIVGTVAWKAGKWPAVAVGLFAVCLMHGVQWFSHREAMRMQWMQLWNHLLLIGTFLWVGWITATLRNSMEATRQSVRKNQRLLDTMIEPFATVNLAGELKEFNRAFRNLVGYTEEELRTKTYVDLTPARWHAMEARILQEQVFARGYSDMYEKEYQRKDGRVLPVELRTFVVLSDDGQPEMLCAFVRDVTERHRSAEALREAKDQLEQRVLERTAELETVNDALRQSEERYRSLLNNLNVGVFRTTPEPGGKFIEANPALAKIHGYNSVEELMRVPVADLYQDPRDRVHGMEELCRIGHVHDYELRLRRRNGQPMVATMSATAHYGPDRRVEWIDGVLEDVTERRKLERQIMEISDEEQLRIGQDLHDGLCQELVGLAFDVNTLAVELERTGRGEQVRARRVADGLDRAITSARHLARGLFPVRLDGEGLGAALEQLVEGARARFTGQCRFEQSAEVVVESKAVALQLYRIAQEALNNAIKHSRANEVVVRLARHPGLLLLEIQDNGTGMLDQKHYGGMGLLTMRYRARSIGARFIITGVSGPSATNSSSSGTLVQCRLICA